MPDAEERLGVGEGEGFQEHALDDGENRGVGADPEREREDGDRGEEPRAQKPSKDVAGFSDVHGDS
jgi:hypothetical protein